MAVPLSVLDLAPVGSGDTPSATLRRTVDLVRLADRLDFVRYWFAEHHGLPAVASAAPEILIAHAAAASQRIRVGSGGVMLPNHAPLRVVESFKTLEALYPGRIDLGIGRAPGSDAAASRALRAIGGEQFTGLMSELLTFGRSGYPPNHPYASVAAMPTDTTLPPMWILGSSGASAAAAGGAGMGYSFATHFSTEPAAPALEAYRHSFRPSAQFQRPHAILGVSFVCAETQERAQHLALSLDLLRLRMMSNLFLPIPTPEQCLAHPWTEAERRAIEPYRALNVIGTPATVRARIEALAAETGADEIMLVCNIHDHQARLRAYELIAGQA
jgi:luciferase family oxidoreductase group 1